MRGKGFLSHFHHSHKKGRNTPTPDVMRLDGKVYCWQVAPQQSLLPLQLSEAKILI